MRWARTGPPSRAGRGSPAGAHDPRPGRPRLERMGTARPDDTSRRPGWGGGSVRVGRGPGSDPEAQGAQLLAAVLGNLVRTPRRHPHPVDLDVVDQAAARRADERGPGLLLDHVGQRAGRRGQGHVDGGDAALGPDAVDQAQVDDVDAQLGVDHVAHGLLEVVGRGRPRGRRGRLGHAGGAAHHPVLGGRTGLRRLRLGLAHVASFPSLVAVAWSRCAPPLRPTASLNAIQPSRAHFTRAGYRATPAKATPSPRTSSSGSTWPRPWAISWNAVSTRMDSSTLRPTTRS